MSSLLKHIEMLLLERRWCQLAIVDFIWVLCVSVCNTSRPIAASMSDGSGTQRRASNRLHSRLLQSNAWRRVSRVFPERNENPLNSANSGSLINLWSTNRGQFKDPVCVVATPSLTQEIAGLNITILLILHLFYEETAEFSESIKENSIVSQ